MNASIPMNEERRKALTTLEEYVMNWKIFIDTCSLLEPTAEQFWLNIIPLLDKHGKKVIIPYRCIQELQKHQTNTKDKALAKKSRDALKKFNQLKARYIDLRGEPSDNFADNVFNVQFTKFRMQYSLLLITQDRDLAEDLLKLNDSKSVLRAKPIHVKKLNQYGFLSDIYPRTQKKKEKGERKNVTAHPKTSIPEEEKFELCRRVTDLKDDILPLTSLPDTGEQVLVYVNQQWMSIPLRDKLGGGGEATIYATNTPYVAKIYKKDKNTRRRYEKIRLMLTKTIKCEGVCYPVAEVYNQQKQFIGYLMPAAKGKELQNTIFRAKPLFMKNFPNWKKRDTVQLCITMLEKIKYLHDYNVILGDINPMNILVVSPTEVYFVDTDSYQVEAFPCPVGTVAYTAPEIQKKHFGSFLRTMGNENFAVATLLFMTMLPGKLPYSQQGGEDMMQNIINMDFSYPLGKDKNGKTPAGAWRFIWSHLPYAIKEAFYKTFRKGQEYSKETSRLDVDDWLALFREYLRLLDSGKFAAQDPMSVELFPTRFKRSANLTYTKCKICNETVPEDNCRNGICHNCLKNGETYRCSCCGKDMVYTNYQKYIKQSKRFEMCKDCSEKIGYTHTCESCGRTIQLTNGECQFYRDKGITTFPKRCKACRDAGIRKKPDFPTSYNPPPPPPPSSGGSGSFCFLTTAVCEYYGRPDNCFELTTLRHYRDNWLMHQPDGKALITEYYRTAPLIVSHLKASSRYGEYCEKLWKQYIFPCLQLIAQKKYQECKVLYTQMFYFMKSEFQL